MNIDKQKLIDFLNIKIKEEEREVHCPCCDLSGTLSKAKMFLYDEIKDKVNSGLFDKIEPPIEWDNSNKEPIYQVSISGKVIMHHNPTSR